MNGGNDLGELMAGLTDAPSPVSSVSVELAMRTGRSRIRRRRLGVVGTAMAVVLAGGGVLALRPTGPAVVSTPAASAAPLPPLLGRPLTVPATSTSGKNPVAVEVDYGWLPDSTNRIIYQGGSVSSESEFGKGGRFDLRIFAQGQVPDRNNSPVDGLDRQEVAPISGGKAYAFTRPGGSLKTAGYSAMLQWAGPDGRWLQLQGSFLEQATGEQVMRKVAENAVVGPRVLALPVVLTGVPQAYTPSSASFMRQTVEGKSWWSLEVNYLSGPNGYFTTTVTPNGDRPGQVKMPVEGSFPSDVKSDCRVDSGVKVCLSTYKPPVDLDAVGGREGWLTHVRVLGLDESKWTTDVLR